MFIKLTRDNDNLVKIYNTDYIKSFYKGKGYTVVELDHGTDIVKESIQTIEEMLRKED